ncbi:hypothetical protein BP6252_03848 [Coleophoma cylindrospora]|uniref:Uncharacterized protein n=1 Tax=Coleophoma cylindrospora TaxID=1849047 RepID=A0A3D8S8Q7_9HELO|nr:hypothetical protein BP6252_03848 [Coleophoma cylindrospora]
MGEWQGRQGDAQHPEDEFVTTGLCEFLASDERPTFVIDLNRTARNTATIVVVFANAAFRNAAETSPPNFPAANLDEESLDFKTWAEAQSLLLASPKPIAGTRTLPFTFGNNTWTKVTSGNRWQVISMRLCHCEPVPSMNPAIFSILVEQNANIDSPEPAEQQTLYPDHPDIVGGQHETESLIRSLPLLSPPSGKHGNSHPPWMWTFMQNPSSHVRFIRDFDWPSTPIGPLETWPVQLCQMLNIVIADPEPAVIFWGPELVMVYNEAYIPLIGHKHPLTMGNRFADCFPDVWEHFDRIFSHGRTTKQAIRQTNVPLFLDRGGFIEETYFSYTFLPLLDHKGDVVGFYEPVTNVAQHIIADRRMATVSMIGELTSTSTDLKGVWSKILEALDPNQCDIPFAVLYSTEHAVDSTAGDSESSIYVKECILEGTIGFSGDSEPFPDRIDILSEEDGSYFHYFREVYITGQPCSLQIQAQSRLSRLLPISNKRGFGDRCNRAVVIPIRPTAGDRIVGILLIGLNPRLEYNQDHQLFIRLLSRQLATSVAATVLLEAETRSAEEAAAKSAAYQARLKEKVQAKILEAKQSEEKFARFAQVAPMGLCILGAEATAEYSNETWRQLTGFHGQLPCQPFWTLGVLAEDQPLVEQEWRALMNDSTLKPFEFRLQSLALQDPFAEVSLTEHRWFLASLSPQLREDGTISTVMACFTEITHQKQAEALQKLRLDDALQNKIQMERFIDMTSHEIRNPMSAIIQSADEIINTLMEFRTYLPSEDASIDAFIESNIDASNTILLCAQHQKRIIDDILVLSKLSSSLLQITPTCVHPARLASDALRMFEAELQAAKIDAEVKISDSVERLAPHGLLFDFSRVLQILINLLTNAIKFTRHGHSRSIRLALDASLDRPSNDATSAAFLPKMHPDRNSKTSSTEIEVFLHFTVQDTGVGLTVEEMAMLFQRFSQASPRTHVQYGGSGLGLFIARELAEIQGGQIGVSSEYGIGTLFKFYISTKRPQLPDFNNWSINSLSLRKSDPTPEFQGPRIRLNSFSSPPPLSMRTSRRKVSCDLQDIVVLIVEDNLINQKVMSKQLRKLGWTIHLANHGGEALTFLPRTSYWNEAQQAKDLENPPIELTVVLLDLEMPTMGGLECIAKIRELQEKGTILGHVPVIAITANAREEQIALAMDAGMDAVVTKPFQVPKLVAQIQELLSRLV